MPAVPVEDQQAGVIGQDGSGDFDNEIAEDPHDLPGVQRAQVQQLRGEVQGGGAAFEHAVGEQHQPVAGL